MEKTVSREHALFRITWWGALVNLVLLLFKFTAGILGRSGAMLADATHSLSDFGSDIVVLLFVKLSSKPKDASHRYGHGKYETFATLIIGIFLFGAALYLCSESVKAIIAYIEGTELQQPTYIALVAAVVSIVLKEGLFRITLRVGKRYNSSSVIANAWHHRSDAYSSIGTAVGIAGATLLGPKWAVLDPIAAAVVSVFIFKSAISIALPSINELLEHALPEETENEIRLLVAEESGFSNLHNLRTRRIGNAIAIEFHVRVDGDMRVADAHALTKNVEKRLREYFGQNTYISIHVEPDSFLH